MAFMQGIFKPKNPTKYVGTFPIVYRSGWELTMMQTCDNHPNILQWASESIQIPYINPLKGRWARYIPDFFIVYVDKDGKKHLELIEVKPMSQTFEDLARTDQEKEAFIVNKAKWAAAREYCAKITSRSAS